MGRVSRQLIDLSTRNRGRYFLPSQWQNYREKQGAKNSTEQPKPEPRVAASAAEVEDASKNYDFYKMLKKYEVEVPEKDLEVSREQGTTPVTIERPGVYVQQAGSYRKQEDADRIQAQL